MKTTTSNPAHSEIADADESTSDENKPSPFVKILDSIKPENPISMKSAFYTVLGLHLLAVAGLVAFSANSSAQASQLAEDKKYVLENAPMVGVESSETPKAKPEKEPARPTVVVEQKAVPKPKIIQRVPDKPNPNYPQFAREYVVQKGDTFTRIVKKYRLDAAKLKSINGIKDENKLAVGQKLKLL